MTPLPKEQIAKADAVRALLHEAKSLAARYYALTGKPLGVTGEVAELEAAEKLNLVLSVARNPDYDALRNEGSVVERFQIKGRAVDPMDRYRGRAPSIKYDGDFEWVLLVLLDRSTFDALEIWEASRQDVAKRLQAPGSRARNERNSMAITQFKSIACKIWSEPHATDRHFPRGRLHDDLKGMTGSSVAIGEKLELHLARGDGLLIPFSSEPLGEIEHQSSDARADFNFAITKAILRKSGRSWRNLRRACLDLQGILVSHSTSAVGSASKTLARNVVKATNMSFREIIEMLDSREVGLD
jgi:hypothetical protein